MGLKPTTSSFWVNTTLPTELNIEKTVSKTYLAMHCLLACLSTSGNVNELTSLSLYPSGNFLEKKHKKTWKSWDAWYTLFTWGCVGCWLMNVDVTWGCSSNFFCSLLFIFIRRYDSLITSSMYSYITLNNCTRNKPFCSKGVVGFSVVDSLSVITIGQMLAVAAVHELVPPGRCSFKSFNPLVLFYKFFF